MPCSLALGQLQSIETKATQYQHIAEARVRVLEFIE